jgi:hypothetical protein
MQVSIPGLILGGAYLVFVLYLAGRVVARDSFGGLFSEEFPLAVMTLPGSFLAERSFRTRKYCRLVSYLVAGGLNASLFYLLGMGVAAAVRWLSTTPPG